MTWTENEGAYDGNAQYYNFYIGDGHTGTSCYVTGVEDPGDFTTPTIGNFMLENAEQNGGTDPLAQFGTPSFSGAEIYTGGSLSYINSFYPVAYNMENQAGSYPSCHGNLDWDVSAGSLSSGGDFTLAYNSSINTPAWNTDC